MPLRKRISLVAAAAVAVAVAIACAVSYFVVRDQLLGQVDRQLLAQAASRSSAATASTAYAAGVAASRGPGAVRADRHRGRTVVFDPGHRDTTDVSQAVAVAAGTQSAYLTDVTVHGSPLRMYSFGYRSIRVDAEPLARSAGAPARPVDNVLAGLRLILVLVFLAGIALAAGLGRMATRRVLAPLAEVTAPRR